MFALTLTLLLPIGLNLFAAVEAPLNTDEALKGYYDFTGSRPAQESIWVLTGIYTPFGADADGNEDLTHYGYTDDGWLYGTRIVNYTPYQYRNNVQTYSVTRADDGVYRYVADTTYGDHKEGDLYTDVSMSVDKQSQIFFTPDLKTISDNGYFYYDYTGYRYAFQPTASYKSINNDGNPVEVVQNTSSLSLIWYNYYTTTGISGQLIISGEDMSVAYLTASQIVQAFNSTTNTAKFTLNFTGIPMNVYVKIDPTYLTQMSVQECYDLGYWSVMVTSESADGTAYTGADYGINITTIWNTIVNLFTFNYDNYDIPPALGVLCTLIIVAPLYAMLLAICSESWQMLVAVSVMAAIQAIATFVTNPGAWSFLGGLF